MKFIALEETVLFVMSPDEAVELMEAIGEAQELLPVQSPARDVIWRLADVVLEELR